jgi:hypothetical protein
MPESDFSRLNPHSGVDRVGGIDDRSSIDLSRTVRHDQTLHLPLSMHTGGPGVLVRAPAPITPTPPAPGEAERRSELKAALDAQVIAQAALAQAEATHMRAREHAQRCRATLESFGNLDSDLKADLLDQLRSGQRDVTSSRELRDRVGARAQIELDYVLATETEHTCASELTQATTAATAADTEVHKAVARVAGFHAVAVAVEREALLAQAQELLIAMHAFDFWCTRHGVTVPAPVLSQLRDGGLNLAARPDQGAWVALGERLLADPNAAFGEAA